MELNAQGDGTVTDAEFGRSNEQVDGRLRLLTDKPVLNNPDRFDFRWESYAMAIISFVLLLDCNQLSQVIAMLPIL